MIQRVPSGSGQERGKKLVPHGSVMVEIHIVITVIWYLKSLGKNNFVHEGFDQLFKTILRIQFKQNDPPFRSRYSGSLVTGGRLLVVFVLKSVCLNSHN